MANPGRKYQHHSVARKREIVEASLRGDESVAVVAREYGVNANQIWAWRKLYSEGRLDNGPVVAGSSASTLLAVDVIEEAPTQPVTASHGGCLEITVGQARLRATGAIDPELLRTALVALLA
ncbi:transposase [Bordetella sp. FB-8]|uniref:transposase n=1 Tax=Bordetella sp. FB-8 TaxID=1159870 RepID=UPI000373657F|nr:transposase [Bordetella sp. FB-8]